MTKLVLIVIFIVACGQETGLPTATNTTTASGDWEIWTTSGKSGAITHMSYQHREIRILADLTTPLGTFTPVARRHSGSPSGWAKASSQRNEDVKTDATKVMDLRAGYYEAQISGKSSNTPASWVYVRGKRFSAWIDPSKLADDKFARSRFLNDSTGIWIAQSLH